MTDSQLDGKGKTHGSGFVLHYFPIHAVRDGSRCAQQILREEVFKDTEEPAEGVPSGKR
jgi:hypothetical protein